MLSTESVRTTRILSRWLFARRQLGLALKAVLPDLQKGDVGPALKALDDLWSQMGLSESVGDMGTVTRIEAEWFYALGARDQGHFKDLIRKIQRLRPQLVFDRDRGAQPHTVAEFEAVVADAAWLEKVMRADDEDTFPHGDFTIIPMRGVSRSALADCLGALDDAANHIRAKGFGEVLYGNVYIKKPKRPLGLYSADHDAFSLSIQTRADNFSLHAIVHELGHRFDFKFWKNREQRTEFIHLSTSPEYEMSEFDKPTRGKLADEWLSNAKVMRDGAKPPKQSEQLTMWIDERMKGDLATIRAMARKFVYDKDDSAEKPLWDLIALPNQPTVSIRGKIIREPLYVSPYGKEKTLDGKWNENFAEAFAHYVLGKPLPAEIAAIMGHLK